MRAVLQRVTKAEVRVESRVVGQIGKGLLVFLGISHEDKEDDCRWLVDKISGLRIFEDQAGKMNLSLADIGGEVLLVSQFTLYGDCRRGKRPSWSRAARPEQAKKLYELFAKFMQDKKIKTACGVFQADMEVNLSNDGPVTMLLDSEKVF